MDTETLGDQTKEVLRRELSEQPARHRVFVAESDPDMRELIAAMLRDHGYEVVEVSNGVDLVNTLIRSLTSDEPRRPGLIILEAQLPGWSGIDVIRRLRRFDRETPVILLSSQTTTQLVAEADALGVLCLLEYPFDYAELNAAALSALEPG